MTRSPAIWASFAAALCALGPWWPSHGLANGWAAEIVEPPLVPAARPSVIRGELATPHFRILYTPRAEGSARALSRSIEEMRDRFRESLGRDWPGETEVRVGFDRAELEALALPGPKPPSWAIALAYPAHNLLIVDAHSLAEADGAATLRHELAHVALGQLGGPWPRWFHEGLAMHLTGEQRYSLSHYATLVRAVHQDRIFAFEDLSESWPDRPADVEVAYAQSVSFVAFLTERRGSAALSELVSGVKSGEPFETAFAKAFGTTLRLEERSWRDELPGRYSWLPIITGGSTLWVLAALVCVAGYIRRRRRSAARRAEIELEEAARAAAARILAAEPEGRFSPGALPEEDGPEPPEREEAGDYGPKPKPTLH
ncbi:MAG: hypothetical protein HYZ28_23435 [Myxococcales bacterium]|nr:hypothetical protein [Myxococcales bacterium]